MPHASLNMKLMAIVILAVLTVAVAIIGISSMSGLQQLVQSSERSEARIASLIAGEQAGNIKFGKSESLDDLFAGFAADKTFNFAFAAAYKPEGEAVSEKTVSDRLSGTAKELALSSISKDAQISTSVDSFHLVAVPARFGKENAVVGVLVIGWDQTPSVNSAMGSAVQTGLVALLLSVVALGGLAVVLRMQVSSPLRRLTSAAVQLANSKYDVEIFGTKRSDELGEMARAVEVFRENAVRIRDMGEQEVVVSQQRREERAQMMQDLQRGFGKVVDAAIAGDFSRRVEASFPDEELNALAGSVNDLVETVDRGVGETGRVLGALADTDLTQRVEGDFRGAFDKLKSDTNAVADRLAEIVGQIKQTSRGLKTATGEILSGANDLSERTTKQAATIEETGAAMEHLAQTVMENARKAASASEQAKKASTTAEEGGVVMHQANEAMERISSSSARISNIIGMIDDIAFQTNLLALNASVEAARAGEAGKGFAVVAIEVRRLAQSAAEASSEVKALIEQSGNEVSGGTKLVASAAEKLSAILGAVRTNAAQMEGIAHDSREQASAIDEVNVAVRQMDEMTQHNAALVEETNAAIEQTESQASELDRIVDVFTLADTGAAPSRQSASRAAPTRPAEPRRAGVRGVHDKVAKVAKTYLSNGNAALKTDKDWNEF